VTLQNNICSFIGLTFTIYLKLFFSLVLSVIHLRDKFEVSSFNHFRDIRGVPKFQKWVMWPPRDFFDLILHFFVNTHCRQSLCQILKFLASTDTDIHVLYRGSQNSKNGLRDTYMTPFNLSLQIFDISPSLQLCVKFGANSFVDDRYIAILRLHWFGCEMRLRANFGEFLGIVTPKIVKLSFWLPKVRTSRGDTFCDTTR